MRDTVYDNRSHDTKADLVVVAVCSAGFHSCRNRLQTLEMNLTMSERSWAEEKPKSTTRRQRCAPTHASRIAVSAFTFSAS